MGIAYVGWRPVNDDGKKELVRMRSGCGELGYWHRHADAPDDFGGNPVDDGICRTCGWHAPTECSICRRRHGLEVIHECE